ncbi:MAG: cytochrome ubiquinol oxidase subunit I [Proteobacteria bacterium]|nr:cytochrome ubiquinol oxidase subunit I [Pseudomonadota bacterium]
MTGLFLLLAAPATAADEVAYRTVLGISPRLVVWVVAELHLMFAALVLGVPIFAVIVELVGYLQSDPDTARRYDALAYEFTRLLSGAFATTAAFGGLLTFTLYSSYPAFMSHLTGVFHSTFYFYALLFFAEGFTLYVYYYGWKRMARGRSKILHIWLGVQLNLVGTALMVIANSWATYMMSPPGLEQGAAGTLASHWQGTQYIGSTWDAFANYLWMPLNIHRMLGNVAFGGAICGAYAAIRFLGSRSDRERAHYDWMGYVGNFIALTALIPLPFAGYYLGREIYSFNATMGQDMMGGTFSWTFILQAVFVGTLFIAGNFYLWSGMRRIPGGERYERYVPWMLGILFCCFAVWLTPHNLPAGGLEKKFGLMPAKNAVIQLMILTTFAGFLMYRRSNKVGEVSVRAQGRRAVLLLLSAVAVGAAMLLRYAGSGELSDANPEISRFVVERLPVAFASIDFGGSITWAATLRWTLYHQVAWLGIAVLLTLRDRGRLGQALLVGVTALHASAWLFQHGFSIMEKANPLVRQVAVSQVLILLSCLLLATAMDLLLYRGAASLGEIRWGRMHRRSQFSLLLLCVFFVFNMGLMGFIRSGLRKGWHVVSVIKDSSAWAGTPSNLEMAVVVSGISITFLLMVSFVFWTVNLVSTDPGHTGGDPGSG